MLRKERPGKENQRCESASEESHACHAVDLELIFLRNEEPSNSFMPGHAASHCPFKKDHFVCIRDMNLNRVEDRTRSRWFRIRTAGRGGGRGKSEKCEIKMIGIKWSVRNEAWEDKQESRMTMRNLARWRQKPRRKSKFGNKGNMFVFCYAGWDIHIKMTNGWLDLWVGHLPEAIRGVQWWVYSIRAKKGMSQTSGFRESEVTKYETGSLGIKPWITWAFKEQRKKKKEFKSMRMGIMAEKKEITRREWWHRGQTRRILLFH